MDSVTDFLVRGMTLTLPERLMPYVTLGIDTTCAITGEHITVGIPWKYVIPSSTGEYLDLMHGMTFEYLSISAAVAFKGSWNMGSRFIFEDGTAYHPYIARNSADKNERTYWSMLVREVWPKRKGQKCLCIVAGDFKKKVWPRASVGPLGMNTPVYVLDPGRFVSQCFHINWQHLIQVLDFVEELYIIGFCKHAIEYGLYFDYATLSTHLEMTLDYEIRLQTLRTLPEFAVSILIAQKGTR